MLTLHDSPTVLTEGLDHGIAHFHVPLVCVIHLIPKMDDDRLVCFHGPRQKTGHGHRSAPADPLELVTAHFAVDEFDVHQPAKNIRRSPVKELRRTVRCPALLLFRQTIIRRFAVRWSSWNHIVCRHDYLLG